MLPFRMLLYEALPPTRYFRHAAFFRVGFLFAIAVLACLGARDLAPRALARSAFACAAVGAAASFSAYAALGVEPTTEAIAWIAGLHVLALVVGALAHVGKRAWSERALALLLVASSVASLRLDDALVSGPPDLVERLDAEHVARLEPVDLDRHLFSDAVPAWKGEALLAGDYAPLAEDLADPVGRLFDSSNLPAKVPVLAGYTALNNEYHHALAGSPGLLRQALGTQRVFFAHDALGVEPTPQTFAALVDGAARDDVPLLLHDKVASRPDESPDAARARLEPIGFEVAHSDPRTLELRVAPRETEGWLMVTERFAAGWSATVDGRPAQVHRANFLWRAVELPRNATTVRFRYAPFGYPVLPLLSWSVLALLVAWSIRARRARGLPAA
ncbi:MAG: hypothetical protein R3F34_18140 [Planctomycetota bacterium]